MCQIYFLGKMSKTNDENHKEKRSGIANAHTGIMVDQMVTTLEIDAILDLRIWAKLRLRVSQWNLINVSCEKH